LPYASCQPNFVFSVDDIRGSLESLFRSAPDGLLVHSAWKLEGERILNEQAEYAVVFGDDPSGGPGSPVLLLNASGRVLAIYTGCGAIDSMVPPSATPILEPVGS